MKQNLPNRVFQTILWLVLASVALPGNALSQGPLQECREIASDPDGDGFGWEWNGDLGALSSCAITASSRAPQPIVNRETGETVQLVRAYWNANRDIANRNIQCVGYYFDEAEGLYEPFDRYISNLRHEVLPTSPPYMALAEFDSYPYHVWPDQTIEKIWTVIDGQYFGPMTGAWIEILDATDLRPAGIRVWGTDPNYRECFDMSGAPLAPTGFIGEDLPSTPVERKSLIAQGPTAPVYAQPPVNLETGEPVQLSDVYWDIYADFWERQVSCMNFEWDGSQYANHPHTRVLLRFYAVSTGPQSGFVGFNLGLGDSAGNSEWRVVDGTFESDLKLFDRMEIVTEGKGSVRSWNSSESYVQCWDSGAVVGPYTNGRDERGLIPETSVAETGTADTGAGETGGKSSDAGSANTDAANTTGDGTLEPAGKPNESGGGGVMESRFFFLLLLHVLLLTAHRLNYTRE